MTNKNRAYLTKLAVDINPVLILGKENLTPEFTEEVINAFNKKELIKIGLQKTVTEDINEVAEKLASRSHSEVVRVIGRKIILYKKGKKPKIELPEKETANKKA